MKWIGQHIWDFVSRFRNEVYLEDLTEHVDYDAETLVKDNTTGLVQWTKRANAGKVHLYVKAAEDLVAGNAVYASGAVGNSQAIEVSKYIANNTIDERRFVGITEQDLLAGEFGYVVTIGTLKGIDTTGAGFATAIGETWLEGDILFASPTYAGELTKTQPSAPNQVIPCAFILKKNASGTIAIRAYDLGYHLNELHDLEITAPTEGEVLRYNDVSDIWENTDSLVISASGNVTISGRADFQKDFRLRGTDAAANQGVVRFYVDSSNKLFIDTANDGSNLFAIDSSGNVGIGITNPTNKLHVIGDTRIEGDLTVNGTYTQIDTDVLTTEQWLVTNDGTGPAVVINQLGSQDIFDVQDDGTSVFYIEDGGQIGIGTTNPTARLHIESADDVVVRLKSTDNKAYIALSDNDTDGYISSENSRLSLGAYPNVHANNLNIDLSNNNVGIGTTSPNEKLTIEQTSAGADVYPLQLSNVSTTDSTGVGIVFNVSSNTAYPNARILVERTDSDATGEMSFWTVSGNSGAISERMRIDKDGNVGIGTTSPSEKLEVNGNIKASGTLIAKQYQAFQCNFINDISTTKYYLPLDTVTAQTVRYQDEACMLAHADGRLASVTLKVENLGGASGNITFGIEVLQSTGTGYSGTWTVVETETMAIASTHNHDVFHFHFSTAKHFDSTHMFAISIQSDNAALGGDGGNDERWFVTPVIEWDYNTYLGTNGTSTRYDTTP